MARLNLVENPSFRQGLANWNAINGASLAVTTSQAFYGNESLQVTKAAQNSSGAQTDYISVQGGQSYAYSTYVRVPITVPATETGNLVLKVTWYNTLNQTLGDSTSQVDIVRPADGWVRLTGVDIAPSTAVKARVSVTQLTAGTAGQTFMVDATLFEQASFVGGYLDNVSQAEEDAAVNTGLTPLPAPTVGGLPLEADIVLGDLVLNTIDENNIVWVCTDIDGWWGQSTPEIPDIPRGVEDGSYDVTGRYQARVMTLKGTFLLPDPSLLGKARDILVSATNLVRKGAWLRTNENPTRAAFVRLSGKPQIQTVNARGRTDFSITLKAADPIRYEWNDQDPDGITTAAAGVDVTDQGRTNLYPYPGFEVTGATQQVITYNYFTNPSFEAAGSTAVVRTNLCPNPSLEASLGTYTSGTNATVARVADTMSGGFSLQHVVPATGNSFVYDSTATGGVAVSVGTVYTVSMNVKAVTGLRPLSIGVVWRTSAGAAIGGATAGASWTPTATGQTNRVSYTSTAPATAATMQVYLSSPNAVAGDEYHWDALLIEATPIQRPYFEGSTTTTNLALNPRATLSTSLFPNNSATHTITKNVAITGHPQGITTAAKGTFTPGHAATPTLTSIYNMDGLSTNGVARWMGVWVYSSLPNMKAYWFTDGQSAATLIPQNQWVFVTSTLPTANNTIASFAVLTADSSNIVDESAYVLVTGIVAQDAPNVTMFHDASLTDYTYAWTGTANASTSTMSGTAPAGAVMGNGNAIQSTAIASGRGKAARLVPNTTGQSTTLIVAATTAGSTYQAQIAEGNTYTIMATRTLLAPLTGTLAPTYAGRIALITTNMGASYSDTILPNTAGSGTIVWTFTVPVGAGTSTLRLGHGGGIGSGDVFWDDILLTDGTYTGAYFDGATSAPSANEAYGWSGAANNSASTLSALIAPDSVVTKANALPVISTVWSYSGTRSLYVRPRSPGTKGTLLFASSSGSSPVTLTKGKTYTVAVRHHMATPAPFPNDADGPYTRRLVVSVTSSTGTLSYVTSNAAPNIVGDTILRVSFAVPQGGNASVYYYGDGDYGHSSEVYLDEFTLIDETGAPSLYSGDPFTGDTPTTSYFSYGWDGTPGSSTSHRFPGTDTNLVATNIGTADVTAVFELEGPLGAGSTVTNLATGETITTTSELRGVGATATINNKQLLNNIATLTTDNPHDLLVGDQIIVSGVGSPFDAVNEVLTVTAVTTTFPYTFSYSRVTADIDSTPTSGGQVALANNDLLSLDTYDRSVTFNGELLGNRSRVETLVDWIKLAPGDNPILFQDAPTHRAVTTKGMASNEATLTTDDSHFFIPGERVVVKLPVVATLAKKSLANNVVTLTTATNHGFSVGDKIDVVSVETSVVVNKALTSNVATLTTQDLGAFSIGDTITVSLPTTKTISAKGVTSNVATITTSSAHGYSIGDSVTIALNTTANVTTKSLTSNVATLTTATNHGFSAGDTITVALATSANVTTKYMSGSSVVLTTSAAHNFSVGDKITVAFPTSATPVAPLSYSGVSGGYLVTVNTTAAHNFSIGDSVTINTGLASTAAITTRQATTTVATITTAAAHNFGVGEAVTVTGLAPQYNSTWIISAVTATTFSFTGSFTAEGATADDGLATNTTIRDGYNGTKIIETIPSATSFTYIWYGPDAGASNSTTLSGTVANNTNVLFNGTYTITSVPSSTQLTYTRS